MNASSAPLSSKDAVMNKIHTDYCEFRSAARNWSGLYHSLQFGSAALSAFAALALKTESFGSVVSRNDLGAICAALAALAISILITGRFKEKWEANRIAAFAVRDLDYQIEKSDANPDAILSELQRIGLTRNNTIIGLPTELKKV